MVYRGVPNCKHLDNFQRCRVHIAHWLVRWLLPKGRPHCILMSDQRPQDGEFTCPNQVKYPPPGVRAMPSSANQ